MKCFGGALVWSSIVFISPRTKRLVRLAPPRVFCAAPFFAVVETDLFCYARLRVRGPLINLARGTQSSTQSRGGHRNDSPTRHFPGLDQDWKSDLLVIFMFYSCEGYTCDNDVSVIITDA